MEKLEKQNKINQIVNNPDYEFRRQASGVRASETNLKCGICGNSVNQIVETIFNKTNRKSIGFCADCYNILQELK